MTADSAVDGHWPGVCDVPSQSSTERSSLREGPVQISHGGSRLGRVRAGPRRRHADRPAARGCGVAWSVGVKPYGQPQDRDAQLADRVESIVLMETTRWSTSAARRWLARPTQEGPSGADSRQQLEETRAAAPPSAACVIADEVSPVAWSALGECRSLLPLRSPRRASVDATHSRGLSCLLQTR